MSDYHGVKPVTDDDKKMAKIHLKASEDLIDDKEDVLKGKIKDHSNALKARLKVGDKKSASYNRAHMEDHQDDLDEAEKAHAKIYKSLDTLSSLKTGSRKVYNDVRKAKVALQYKKAEVESNG